MMMLQGQVLNSKIKPGGNRTNDPNYDGVNVYGDETSANLVSCFQFDPTRELLQALQPLQEDYSQY